MFNLIFILFLKLKIKKPAFVKFYKLKIKKNFKIPKTTMTQLIKNRFCYCCCYQFSNHLEEAYLKHDDDDDDDEDNKTKITRIDS